MKAGELRAEGNRQLSIHLSLFTVDGPLINVDAV